MDKKMIAFSNLYRDYCNRLITEEQYKIFSAILFQNLMPVEIQAIVIQTILLI